MEHPPYLDPEQKFLRTVFVYSTGAADYAARLTLWIVTGQAALLGLVISHIESISKIISSSALKWGTVLMTISILFGIIAKHIAVVVHLMTLQLDQMYKDFNSEEGQIMLSSLKTPIPDLAKKISQAFLWPLRCFFERRFIAGSKQPLAGEIKAVRWMCFFIYFSTAQWILGVIALLCFAFGIQ